MICPGARDTLVEGVEGAPTSSNTDLFGDSGEEDLFVKPKKLMVGVVFLGLLGVFDGFRGLLCF